MGRTLSLTLLLLVVIAAMAWLVLHAATPHDPVPANPAPDDVAREHGDEAADVDAPAPPPIRIDPRLSGTARGSEDEDGRGGLWVLVVGPEGERVDRGQVRLAAPKPGVDITLVGSFHDGRWRVPRGRLLANDIPLFWLDVYGVGSRLGHAHRGPYATELEGPITVVLPRGSPIRGRVVDESGMGVAGIFVGARSPEGAGPSAATLPEKLRRLPGSVRTTSDGSFTIRGLAPGLYVLVADAPPKYRMPEPLTVQGGEANAVIVLALRPDAEVTVLDPRGKPVVGAVVTARATYQDHGPSFEAETDRQGVARLGDLDVDRVHTLEITPPETRSDLLSLQRSDWRPDRETIALERAWAVEGIVHDRQGRPVAGARVSARAAGGRWSSTRSLPDGSFRVDGLPEGPVRLEASGGLGFLGRRRAARSHADLGPEPVTVAAGSRGVVLECETGAQIRVRLSAGTLSAQAHSVIFGMSGVYRVGSGTVLEDYKTVLFSFLDPTTPYRVWIHDPEHGQYAEIKTIKPSDREVVVEMQEGGRITGVVRSGASTMLRDLDVVLRQTGRSVHATVERDGRFVADGLPAGPWTIYVHALESGEVVLGTATAGIGDDVVVRLEPKPNRK